MQNKKMYIKPVLESETFVPQNYIAACGDTEYGDYLFKCNVPRGTLYYFKGRTPSGPMPNYGQTGNRLGGYKPCSEKHQASTQDDFYWGYVDYNDNGEMNMGEEVIVWLERGWLGGIRDYHVTKELNQDSWEHAKS